jgi:hypothetical protein
MDAREFHNQRVRRRCVQTAATFKFLSIYFPASFADFCLERMAAFRVLLFCALSALIAVQFGFGAKVRGTKPAKPVCHSNNATVFQVKVSVLRLLWLSLGLAAK